MTTYVGAFSEQNVSGAGHASETAAFPGDLT